ncbi:hypothetical protein [Rhizobium leguminosarum]|uniref:hypothetical protein n=1 Tax=Rhizobium leguminosarum TaxID=384 RepID=UPI001C900BBD|nr:hypothetical protein [Rhizobium leguminosarum]MBY2911375.1 hypothetical protein [Rhizobium leguminosarum]
MSGLLPIVEQLMDAESDAERADWLLHCPYGVLHREQVPIRTILQTRRFEIGVAYLDALLSMTNATRLADGQLPQTIVLAVHIAAGNLKLAALERAEGAL